MLTINLEPLRLNVWSKGSPDPRSLIKFQSTPSKGFDQVFNGSFDKPASVGVFDAKNKCSIVPPCKQIIVQRRSKAADM